MNLILPENIVFHFEKSHYHSKTIFVFFCKLQKNKYTEKKKKNMKNHGCVGGEMDSGFE